MKVKIFSKCGGYFSKLAKISSLLEKDINDWIESNKNIKIIHVQQSSSGGSLEPDKHLVSVWYELKE